MPLYTRVHNSYVKVIHFNKTHFRIKNLFIAWGPPFIYMNILFNGIIIIFKGGKAPLHQVPY